MTVHFIVALCLLLACLVPVSGQDITDQFLDLDTVPHFVMSDERSLSASGTKWTIHAPANIGYRVYIVGVSIYCEQACEVTQTKDGTTPSGTAVTSVAKLNMPGSGGVKDSVVTLYHSSNSTGGTSIAAVPVQAGIPQPFTVKASFQRGVTSAQNYSFAVSSITGKARIIVITAQKKGQ